MKPSSSFRPLKRADVIAVGALVLVALGIGLFFWLSSQSTDDKIAVITVEGETVWEENLTRNQKSETFTLYTPSGRPLHFSLEGQRIRFVDAQCPDKVCENSGWVEQPGNSAVCLPFETILRVYSASERKG